MSTFNSQPSKTASLRPIIIAVATAFVLGAALVGYFGWKYYDAQLAQAQQAPEPVRAQVAAIPSPASPTPSPSATEAEAAQAVERVEEQQGGFDQRLVAAEQRLARLDLQSQAAAGNAARAEGLLIAFATRRAMERGAELGYLADQLRLRFGDALPNAVRTVITTSRDPITLDELLARLEGLGPRLADAQVEPSWDKIKQEISSLFVVRRETSPSPQPQRRLERARLFLESGRVEAAIEEVRNLPGAQQAKPWIEDAERYAAAMRALDLIETAAVLEPRNLRDGTGRRIEQLSPAGDVATN